MKTTWRTLWQQNDIVVYRDEVEVDRLPAERIERVYLVYRGQGDTPNDIAQTIVELAGDGASRVFEPETGFAGRVNFERQTFWQERRCVYWVAAPSRSLPWRLRFGAWRGEATGALPPPRPRRARRLRRALAARRAADLGRPQAAPDRAQPPVRHHRAALTPEAASGVERVGRAHRGTKKSPVEAGLCFERDRSGGGSRRLLGRLLGGVRLGLSTCWSTSALVCRRFLHGSVARRHRRGRAGAERIGRKRRS